MKYTDSKVVSVIGTIGSDNSKHGAKQSFCGDPTCECHKDKKRISDGAEG